MESIDSELKGNCEDSKMIDPEEINRMGKHVLIQGIPASLSVERFFTLLPPSPLIRSYKFFQGDPSQQRPHSAVFLTFDNVKEGNLFLERIDGFTIKELEREYVLKVGCWSYDDVYAHLKKNFGPDKASFVPASCDERQNSSVKNTHKLINLLEKCYNLDKPGAPITDATKPGTSNSQNVESGVKETDVPQKETKAKRVDFIFEEIDIEFTGECSVISSILNNGTLGKPILQCVLTEIFSTWPHNNLFEVNIRRADEPCTQNEDDLNGSENKAEELAKPEGNSDEARVPQERLTGKFSNIVKKAMGAIVGVTQRQFEERKNKAENSQKVNISEKNVNNANDNGPTTSQMSNGVSTSQKMDFNDKSKTVEDIKTGNKQPKEPKSKLNQKTKKRSTKSTKSCTENEILDTINESGKKLNDSINKNIEGKKQGETMEKVDINKKSQVTENKTKDSREEKQNSKSSHKTPKESSKIAKGNPKEKKHGKKETENKDKIDNDRKEDVVEENVKKVARLKTNKKEDDSNTQTELVADKVKIENSKKEKPESDLKEQPVKALKGHASKNPGVATPRKEDIIIKDRTHNDTLLKNEKEPNGQTKAEKIVYEDKSEHNSTSKKIRKGEDSKTQKEPVANKMKRGTKNSKKQKLESNLKTPENGVQLTESSFDMTKADNKEVLVKVSNEATCKNPEHATPESQDIMVEDTHKDAMVKNGKKIAFEIQPNRQAKADKKIEEDKPDDDTSKRNRNTGTVSVTNKIKIGIQNSKKQNTESILKTPKKSVRFAENSFDPKKLESKDRPLKMLNENAGKKPEAETPKEEDIVVADLVETEKKEGELKTEDKVDENKSNDCTTLQKNVNEKDFNAKPETYASKMKAGNDNSVKQKPESSRQSPKKKVRFAENSFDPKKSESKDRPLKMSNENAGKKPEAETPEEEDIVVADLVETEKKEGEPKTENKVDENKSNDCTTLQKNVNEKDFNVKSETYASKMKKSVRFAKRSFKKLENKQLFFKQLNEPPTENLEDKKSDKQGVTTPNAAMFNNESRKEDIVADIIVDVVGQTKTEIKINENRSDSGTLQENKNGEKCDTKSDESRMKTESKHEEEQKPESPWTALKKKVTFAEIVRYKKSGSKEVHVKKLNENASQSLGNKKPATRQENKMVQLKTNNVMLKKVENGEHDAKSEVVEGKIITKDVGAEKRNSESSKQVVKKFDGPVNENLEKKPEKPKAVNKTDKDKINDNGMLSEIENGKVCNGESDPQMEKPKSQEVRVILVEFASKTTEGEKPEREEATRKVDENKTDEDIKLQNSETEKGGDEKSKAIKYTIKFGSTNWEELQLKCSQRTERKPVIFLKSRFDTKVSEIKEKSTEMLNGFANVKPDCKSEDKNDGELQNIENVTEDNEDTFKKEKEEPVGNNDEGAVSGATKIEGDEKATEGQRSDVTKTFEWNVYAPEFVMPVRAPESVMPVRESTNVSENRTCQEPRSRPSSHRRSHYQRRRRRYYEYVHDGTVYYYYTDPYGYGYYYY